MNEHERLLKEKKQKAMRRVEQQERAMIKDDQQAKEKRRAAEVMPLPLVPSSSISASLQAESNRQKEKRLAQIDASMRQSQEPSQERSQSQSQGTRRVQKSGNFFRTRTKSVVTRERPHASALTPSRFGLQDQVSCAVFAPESVVCDREQHASKSGGHNAHARSIFHHS